MHFFKIKAKLVELELLLLNSILSNEVLVFFFVPTIYLTLILLGDVYRVHDGEWDLSKIVIV